MPLVGGAHPGRVSPIDGRRTHRETWSADEHGGRHDMTQVPRATCVLFAAVAMAIAIAATPAGAKSAVTSPSTGGHHIDARRPNYEVTVSGAFSDPKDSQAFGSASCESGWTVVGGGVATPGTQGGPGVVVNSSYPISAGWAAFMNNTSGTGVTFVVQAICVKKAPKRYAVASVSVDNPSETQTSATATCPAKSKVLGGGSYSSSEDLSVGLNSTFPIQPVTKTFGWAVHMGNYSDDDDTLSVYAICGAVSHYSITTGTKANNPAGQETQAPLANCPRATVVTSGGTISASDSIAVQIETTEQENEVSWLSSENNMSESDSTVRSVVVCAKYVPQ